MRMSAVWSARPSNYSPTGQETTLPRADNGRDGADSVKSRAGRVVLLLCAGAFAVLSAPMPALAQPRPQEPTRLRLTVTQLAPRVVTAASGSLTVTGKITNIGDRRIDDLQVRVQRGQPETSEQQMREALGHNQPTDAGQSAFT